MTVCSGKRFGVLRATLLLCLILPSTGFARIVPVKNPLDGVLDAQLVLIVRKGPNARLFRVDQVFWGDATPGDLIDLGEFQLATVQQYGPPVIDPIAPETRILVFLKHENDPSAPWQPTYFQEAYFWVQKPEDEQRLRNDAQRAVEARRQWEKAEISPTRQRASRRCGRSCHSISMGLVSTSTLRRRWKKPSLNPANTSPPISKISQRTSGVCYWHPREISAATSYTRKCKPFWYKK